MSVTIQVAPAVQRRGPNIGPLGVQHSWVSKVKEKKNQGIR